MSVGAFILIFGAFETDFGCSKRIIQLAAVRSMVCDLVPQTHQTQTQTLKQTHSLCRCLIVIDSDEYEQMSVYVYLFIQGKYFD